MLHGLRHPGENCYTRSKMKKSTAHHPTSPLVTDGTHDTLSDMSDLKLVATFADTTWRIAVPVVLFALGGIYADINLGTKPWLTLLAVVIGFALAGVLVKRQLTSVLKSDSHE